MSDNDSKGEKIYSLKEVLSITASILGTSPQDLVTLTEDKDLSDFDSLNSTLKSISVEKKNKLIDSEFKRGFKKSAKQTEKLFRETFVDDDFTDMQQEDIVVSLRDRLATTSKKPDTSKTITFEQAMQQQGVKELVETLKTKASQTDTLKSEFEQFKGMQYLMNHALSSLEQAGAQFSSNPTIKARQMATLEQELMKVKYRKGEDGLPIVLDEDGDSPRLNKQTAEHWKFDDFVQTLSPVDFSTPIEKKQDKDPYTPKDVGGSSANFGFTKSQLSSIGLDDFEQAKSEGLTAKADYILSVMESNAEKEQQ